MQRRGWVLRAGGTFLCLFGVFLSPLSITPSHTESRNHPSWIPEPLQAPTMGWLNIFHGNCSSTESFSFLTKLWCGHMHVLSKLALCLFVVFFFLFFFLSKYPTPQCKPFCFVLTGVLV